MTEATERNPVVPVVLSQSARPACLSSVNRGTLACAPYPFVVVYQFILFSASIAKVLRPVCRRSVTSNPWRGLLGQRRQTTWLQPAHEPSYVAREGLMDRIECTTSPLPCHGVIGPAAESPRQRDQRPG